MNILLNKISNDYKRDQENTRFNNYILASNFSDIKNAKDLYLFSWEKEEDNTIIIESDEEYKERMIQFLVNKL